MTNERERSPSIPDHARSDVDKRGQQPYGGGQNARYERVQEAWSRPPPGSSNDDILEGDDLDHRDQQREKMTVRRSFEEELDADAGFVFGGSGHLPASNSREAMKLYQRLQGGLDQIPDPNTPSEARSDSRTSAS